jgi:hypothetical protein
LRIGLKPKVEQHEGRGIRSCPIFPELRRILDEAFEIFGDKREYGVAASQYRAAANTAMGWKNANLRSEMTRLLRRAGVSGWPRLFHSMRASRQTELQRDFTLHVVCSWLGNSPRIPNAFEEFERQLLWNRKEQGGASIVSAVDRE